MRVFRLGVLVLALLGSACTRSTPRPVTGLYVVQRDEGAWRLVRFADVNAAVPDSLYRDDIEGYAPGTRLALLTAGQVALWDGRTLAPLHACAASCRALSWSADGSALAWVEGESESGRLWVWTSAGARDTGLDTVGEPAWSPVTLTLAIPQTERLVLLDVSDAVSRTLPYAARGKPAWAPEGTRLAVRLASDEVALIMLEPFAAAGLVQPPAYFVQRDALAWSPDGRWLLVTERRFTLREHGVGETGHLDLGGSETLGPQPWLYPLAGGEPEPLPGDPAAAFVRPAWSPDGRYVALARLPIGVADPRPEVWVYEVATRRVVRVLEGAAAPSWP